MSIMTDTEMDGLEPIEKAKRAISYMLGRVRENPVIGYEVGLGTKSFGLLTEAHAALQNKTVEEVRETYAPEATSDPAGQIRQITNALDEAHASLRNREHGGVVDGHFRNRIEEILNQPFER